MMRTCFLFLITLLACGSATAQQSVIRGRVTDTEGKPAAFVSIWGDAIGAGSTSNEQGYFDFKLPAGKQRLAFRTPGFFPLDTVLAVGDTSHYFNIKLRPLSLIPVTKKDRKRTKADTIMRLVVANRVTYMRDTSVYLATLYTKGTQLLNGAPRMFLKKEIAEKLHLTEDRRGIIALGETMSGIRYRSPNKMREYMVAVKTTTNENLFNFNSAPEFQVNFYQNQLRWNGLSDHTFISPLASNAFAYYRYKLIGQFMDGRDTIDAISVIPRHRNQYSFNGTIYIIRNQWRLYGADLSLNKYARIDFITDVNIRQQFVPVNGGDWEPQALTFAYKGSLLNYKNIGYYLQVYSDIKPDTAELKYALFTGEVYHSTSEVYKNNQYLEETRPVPLLPEEKVYYGWNIASEKHQKDKTLADSLQNTSNRFKPIEYAFNGYTLHNYASNSFWNFPSPRSIVFYNTVEGWGLDISPRFTKLYTAQRSLTLTPGFRYSLSNKNFNANVYFNYRYNPFRQSSIYGGIGTDFLDLNSTGTITPFLNSLSTLLLGNNFLKLYQSRFVMAGTTGEVLNGILLNGQIEYANRRSLFNTSHHVFHKDSIKLTSNNPLDPNGNTPLFPEYKALIFQGSVTFTFRQEYKITPAGKFIQPNPFPRLRVNIRKGLPKLGSDVDYSVVSADIFQDRVPVGVFGYLGYYISAGSFYNSKSLYYPDFYQFKGGQGFLFDATLGSFHFLNFYTYSTYKNYFEAHLEHNFAGYFLNQVPLLKRLHLQEIVGGSYLTQGTLPPYKEVYFGIKQRVFRVDYGMAFGKFTERIQGIRLIYNF